VDGMHRPGAEVMKAEPGGRELWLERRKLAEALRSYIAEVVACDAPDGAFAEAAEAFEGFARAFADHPRRTPTWQGGVVDPAEMQEFGAVSGLSNPLAPPLKIRTSSEAAVTGVVSFPPSFEGPPGLVHGGYITAALEELIEVAQAAAGHPGARRTLFVRFRSPCPLNAELHMEAQNDNIGQRKIVTKATMYAGDRVVAEAEGIGRTDRQGSIGIDGRPNTDV